MKTNSLKTVISVVIPVFNEEENIKKLAYEIDHSLNNYKQIKLKYTIQGRI